MKKYLYILLLPIIALFSCTEDTSAYLPQEKENVVVDSVKIEEDNGDGEFPEGALIPGIHLVKCHMLQPNGDTIVRRFKYYMPISINAAKPISLIFEFHGSYTFASGSTPSDPIEGISLGHTLIQHAIKENCIICFPAGETVMSADGSGAVNWQNSEHHLPFVDAMIDYFKGKTPTIDTKRIYSTGQSSGAIFSFVLAFERSDVFAAVAPRAGQMKIADNATLPGRAVPIRVFAGEADQTVIHSAVVSNMTIWAQKIGGYFPADMVLTEEAFEIEKYKKVDTRIWHGGNTDLEIYTLKEEGHGISLSYCMPYMWEFMNAHTLDNASSHCFVTSETKDIIAQCGQKFRIPINYSNGATVTLEDAPADWQAKLENKAIELRAPADFFGNISRQDSFYVKAKLGSNEASIIIRYQLLPPKTYFELGDIYYNADFEPIGVVFWVNNANIREAKIINLEEITNKYETLNFGDFGKTFYTPDLDDGEGNTAKHMKHKADNNLTALTDATSGLVWAAQYSYKNIGGWYMPAINELVTINKNLDMINKLMKEIGGREIKPAKALDGDYLSSTVLFEANQKTFQYFNFFDHKVMEQARDNTSYFRARAVKKVSK